MYDVFEKLMFGDSCLTFCPSLEVVVCFCAGSMAFISLSRFDVYGSQVFGLLLLVGKEPA